MSDQPGRTAYPSVNPFAVAALLLEVIAFIILITILTTEPASASSLVTYDQWFARMNLPYTLALLMIPLGLILAIAGYFWQKRRPSVLGKSVWVAALLLGVVVNPPLWLAGLGPMSKEFGYL